MNMYLNIRNIFLYFYLLCFTPLMVDFWGLVEGLWFVPNFEVKRHHFPSPLPFCR